jgi:hypothetical protein
MKKPDEMTGKKKLNPSDKALIMKKCVLQTLLGANKKESKPDMDSRKEEMLKRETELRDRMDVYQKVDKVMDCSKYLQFLLWMETTHPEVDVSNVQRVLGNKSKLKRRYNATGHSAITSLVKKLKPIEDS